VGGGIPLSRSPPPSADQINRRPQLQQRILRRLNPIHPQDRIEDTDPRYFQAVGIPLLRGRFFEDRERMQNAKVALVSQTFARQFFPGEDPLGKHLHTRIFGDDSIEIVGVVGDTLYSLTDPIMPTIYFPVFSGDWQASSIAVVAQPGLDATTLALPIQKILAQIDPDLPVADVLTMEQSIGKSTLDASFTSLLVLSFAVMALSLAAVGLYGVLSYLVTQRTREIGIRIALGAQRGAVLRRILLDGLQPAWVGLVLGLLGSIFAVRLIRSLLYGASPLDLSVFFAVALVLALVATFACAIPAWRASRLDPTQALRTE
jgi:predicted permease